MKKFIWWVVATLTVVLIGAAIWWGTSEDRKDPLNKTDAFVYSAKGTLYWFELTSRKDKVEGEFHQQQIVEEIGKEPIIDEKEFSITGRKTDKGYELVASTDGESKTYNALLTETEFLVKEQGENQTLSFLPVNEEKLKEYVSNLEAELQIAIYGAEEKEKNRIRTFFSELNSVYGFLYWDKDEDFQLFFKVEEALLQGELSGTLLVMTDTGNENNPYEEMTYVLNGITDGLMLKLFTVVDGQETKLEGNFIEASVSFNLSFWNTDEKLLFSTVTEDEFQQKYEEFKLKAQNH